MSNHATLDATPANEVALEDPSIFQDDDPSADTDATPPPLGVKLTVLRLLNVTMILSFGIPKAVLAYKGQSIAPTTLDWIGGTLLAAW